MDNKSVNMTSSSSKINVKFEVDLNPRSSDPYVKPTKPNGPPDIGKSVKNVGKPPHSSSASKRDGVPDMKSEPCHETPITNVDMGSNIVPEHMSDPNSKEGEEDKVENLRSHMKRNDTPSYPTMDFYITGQEKECALIIQVGFLKWMKKLQTLSLKYLENLVVKIDS